MDISNYLKAGYPCLYISTHEPLRATVSIKAKGWISFSWDCLRGIVDRDTGQIMEDAVDPLSALKWLSRCHDTILLVQNFHHFITSVEVIQEIQNSVPVLEGFRLLFDHGGAFHPASAGDIGIFYPAGVYAAM